jgi:hypothetical protein
MGMLTCMKGGHTVGHTPRKKEEHAYNPACPSMHPHTHTHMSTHAVPPSPPTHTTRQVKHLCLRGLSSGDPLTPARLRRILAKTPDVSREVRACVCACVLCVCVPPPP